MIWPPGFWFRPTDKVLISEYLLRKVMGLPLPSNHILERNLYGESTAPCDVFRDIDESNWHSEHHEMKGVIKKTIYVFTKLVKTNANSSNFSRRAGSGTWSGQTGARMIKNFNEKIIGSRKMFTFKDLKSGKQERGGGSASGGRYHWIMHEYSLDGIYEDLNVNKDVVLCKITRCFKNNGASSALASASAWACGRKRLRLSDEGVVQTGFDPKRPRISSSSSASAAAAASLDQVSAGLEDSEDLLLPRFDFGAYYQTWVDCLQPDDHSSDL